MSGSNGDQDDRDCLRLRSELHRTAEVRAEAAEAVSKRIAYGDRNGPARGEGPSWSSSDSLGDRYGHGDIRRSGENGSAVGAPRER